MPARPSDPTADIEADAPRTIDLPLQTRADVRMLPETADAERRMVEVVWSTGPTARRRSARASCPTPRALRDLLRTRKQLVREQASHVQRIQKTLEDANLELASVLTDIMGQSGRAVLAALAAGETDPERLRVGSREAEPRGDSRHLTREAGAHHRFLLGLHLRQIDAITAIDAEVERDLGLFREAAALLATIPGVGELTAEVISPRTILA